MIEDRTDRPGLYRFGRYPAAYAAFDNPAVAGRDLRGCSYLERCAVLLDVLQPLGPPLQPRARDR
ncbi:hypothetical protein GCM10010358_78040 [Streptomyces minutiscleroticus]|uniref:Uncharacterized protein n=1 Tax=Streptomyces minutiscleroticus TaxID=68238 RepID=A0A918P2E6_9ACTN|nr:hypothetical protein GCM10010358_78040 [Streptomyces minutiscleroticus]